MDFWLRSATLQIGGNRYSMDDLAFDFEVPFEDSDELTTATVNAYNLSANTRNSIKKGDPVIINAGYEGDLGVIFVGQVSGLSHKHSSTEWTTKITATEALDQWLTAQVNKTYTKSIKAKAMVQDLLNIFGIEVGTFELAIDKEYPRGRVCKGKLKDVLKEIVVSDCKSRFLIRCGKIIINNPTDGVNKGYRRRPASSARMRKRSSSRSRPTSTPRRPPRRRTKKPKPRSGTAFSTTTSAPPTSSASSRATSTGSLSSSGAPTRAAKAATGRQKSR